MMFFEILILSDAFSIGNFFLNHSIYIVSICRNTSSILNFLDTNSEFDKAAVYSGLKEFVVINVMKDLKISIYFNLDEALISSLFEKFCKSEWIYLPFVILFILKIPQH